MEKSRADNVGMTNAQSNLNQFGFPPELFEVPEEFISDQTLRIMHAEVCARLLRDHPDSDMLDVLMVERVATTYFYMRQRERNGTAGNPVNYKAMVKMWQDVAVELRKKRAEAITESAVKEKVAGLVVDALNDAIYGLDPLVARTVRDKMVEALEAL